MGAILQDIREKIKSTLADGRLYTAAVLILVGIASFGLGRQSTGSPSGEANMAATAAVPRETATKTEAEKPLPTTQYVASKNGQVYHLPHCSGAKNISPANKITFASKAEAEAAGYRPAANCKGI